MAHKIKAIPKKTNKQIEELATMLQFFAQYPEGAALCIPTPLVGEVESYTHSSNGRLPKGLEKFNVYSYLDMIAAVEKPLPGGAKKKKGEASVEIALYRLNQEGHQWLRQHELEKQEELSSVWREQMESATGLQLVIREHTEQVAQLQYSVQQMFPVSQRSEALETFDVSVLSQRLLQSIEQTQHQIMQEWTRQLQELMERFKVQIASKFQDEWTHSVHQLREMTHRVQDLQSHLQQIGQGSQTLAHLAAEAIPAQFGTSLPDLSKSLAPTSAVSTVPTTSSVPRKEVGLSLTWSELCNAVLAQIPATERISLPDLYDKLHAQGLPIRPGALQDVVLALSGEFKIILVPWTPPLYEIPHPHFAILLRQAQAIYFVQKERSS